jgi:hypothetical protein
MILNLVSTPFSHISVPLLKVNQKESQIYLMNLQSEVTLTAEEIFLSVKVKRKQTLFLALLLFKDNVEAVLVVRQVITASHQLTISRPDMIVS